MIRLTWLHGPLALAPLHDRWRDLAARTGGEVFLTPDWLSAWWPVLGQGRRLATLVAEEHGQLVGLLPFMIDRLILPLPLSVARLAGTDPNTIILTLPVETAHLAAILAAAITALAAQGYVVSFGPLSDAASFAPLLREMTADPALHVESRVSDTHSLFTLPDRFEAYLASMSKKRRAQLRRDLAGLETIFSMEGFSSSPTPQEFDAFVALHSAQWQAVGKGGHFADWAGVEKVYRSLAETGAVRFFSQRAANSAEPLAAQMCLVAGTVCHWRLPARSLDPRAENLSLGKVSLVLMIQRLIEAGVTRIEGGRGEYDYKTSFGAENIPLSGWVAASNRPFMRLRLKLTLWFADLLDLLYYRLWFKRFAPVLRKRLRLAPRPLWPLWIRSSL